MQRLNFYMPEAAFPMSCDAPAGKAPINTSFTSSNFLLGDIACAKHSNVLMSALKHVLKYAH